MSDCEGTTYESFDYSKPCKNLPLDKSFQNSQSGGRKRRKRKSSKKKRSKRSKGSKKYKKSRK